jgi:hypothetical protein
MEALQKQPESAFFSDPSLFASGSCETSDFQISPTEKGSASKFNIKPGKYYVLATGSLNNVSLSAKDVIEIGKQVIGPRSLTLQGKGISYVTLDAAGNKIAGVNLCIFSNSNLFGRYTCFGRDYEVVSDNSGVASYNLAPGNYYIYATKISTDLILFDKNYFTIKDRILFDTLRLKRKY